MIRSTGQIRRDFDRLALLPTPIWDPDQHYHSYILGQIPQNAGRVLEVGSGSGLLSLRLADQADSVLGIDLSAAMVRVARQRARNYPHLSFRVADAAQIDLASENFDVIASLGTLHHLPIERTLERMKSWLAPGGTLVLLDQLATPGIEGAVRSTLARSVERITRLTRTGAVGGDPEAERVWQLHIQSVRFSTWQELQRRVAASLPGARLKRHLFSRYSIRWQKPGATQA